MRGIRGDIAAAKAFRATVVFSPQAKGSKEDARSSLPRRRISPFVFGRSLKPRYIVYSLRRISLKLE
jgi:hypothetical protein